VKGALVFLVACQATTPSATHTPAHDCGSIAETLASVEIGNYAPRDKRDRAVARLRTACDAAALTDADASCLAGATDRAAAERCTPKLALDLDCTDVIAKVRASARKAADPELDRQLDRNYAVMERACDEDGWPLDLKTCVIASGRLEGCASKLTKDLRDRLAKRILDGLQPR
jgi:hypothetical protein